MDQADLLRYAIRVLEESGITYMVVGSFSSSSYGEPRLTQDIDIVVQLADEQMDRLCAAFPQGEFYVSPEEVSRAVRDEDQFNVIHPASGTKVDFIIARTDPWGREQLRRRRRVLLFPDLEGYVASPDDTIIGKMLSYLEGGSEKHLRDITGILKVSADELDWNYIARWADELGLSEIWQAVLKRTVETRGDMGIRD